MRRNVFLEWARRVRFHGPDSTRGRTYNFEAGDSVRVEAAYGMDTVSRSQLARGCVIARIISRGPDQQFGLRADTAYVWADSTNPTTATVIPDDGSQGVVYNMAIEPEPATAATAPPKHVCSECGRTDWCVYPRDGFTGPETMLVAGASVPGIGERPTLALSSRASSP